MADSSNKLKTYELTNPMETFPGLTIDDLNRYLPAIRTVEDMSVTIDNMQEGMFLTKCIDGLQHTTRILSMESIMAFGVPSRFK